MAAISRGRDWRPGFHPAPHGREQRGTRRNCARDRQSIRGHLHTQTVAGRSDCGRISPTQRGRRNHRAACARSSRLCGPGPVKDHCRMCVNISDEVLAMSSVEITLDLPDNLAREAETNGLLKPEAIESLLREEIRRRRVDGLFESADRLAASDASLTETEVEAEIAAVREARRSSDASRS